MPREVANWARRGAQFPIWQQTPARQKPTKNFANQCPDAKRAAKCQACREVAHNGILWESLPVPAFGNVCSTKVKVATIAINPAANEFFVGNDAKSREARLPLLGDYCKQNRRDLESNDLRDAQERRDLYFCTAEGVRRAFYHPWFDPLELILRGMNPDWSYFNGTAVHIDVVACATKSAWRTLPHRAKEILQQNCHADFRRTLSELPSGTVLLSNGVQPQDIPVSVDELQTVDVPPRLRVWRGRVSLNKLSFAFLGWSVTAKHLTLVQKEFLVAAEVTGFAWLSGE